jgi:hypothetical protein
MKRHSQEAYLWQQSADLGVKRRFERSTSYRLCSVRGPRAMAGIGYAATWPYTRVYYKWRRRCFAVSIVGDLDDRLSVFFCSEANFSFCRPRKKDVGIVVEQSTANEIGMIRYQRELYFFRLFFYHFKSVQVLCP